MTIIESLGPAAATLGAGFFVGVLIGYALKKVIKIVSIIIRLFFAGLAYLQYQHIADTNGNKLNKYLKTLLQHFQMELQIPSISG